LSNFLGQLGQLIHGQFFQIRRTVDGVQQTSGLEDERFGAQGNMAINFWHENS
jgi:hypothetical protein